MSGPSSVSPFVPPHSSVKFDVSSTSQSKIDFILRGATEQPPKTMKRKGFSIDVHLQ